MYNTIGSFTWNVILFSYLNITSAIKKTPNWSINFLICIGKNMVDVVLCLLNKLTCSLQERSKKYFSSKTYFAGVFQTGVCSSLTPHTVHYRLSLALWHSSNSNHSWTYRFVPEDWQVYHRWPVPAIGSSRWGPDSTLTELWEHFPQLWEDFPQTLMLPGADWQTRNF